jgi:hypothetical protein
MKKFLIKYMPGEIKILILYLLKKKNDFFDKNLFKYILFNYIKILNKKRLSSIRRKKKLRVIFLTLDRAVWKVDPVFKKMLDDPYFEPVILVCPYGKERMLEDLKAAYEYFDSKGYPVVSSCNEQNATWVQLKDLKPDILFFTNPHNLTRPEYYEEAYKKYLSLYVPYDHQVSKYGNYQPQYNQYFHNAMFKIFVPHIDSLNIFSNYSASGSRNILVTGYPSSEVFFAMHYNVKEKNYLNNVWKKQNKIKKKIIWAPHHTIESKDLKYSNFLEYSIFFKELSIKYLDSIQLAFKPHPILKSKLYEHPDWGKEKTDEYYNFWSTSGKAWFYKTLF